ncbi:MAG TPA: SUF system Fe-S cluster assembly regulator [Polyangia bacterium]
MSKLTDYGIILMACFARDHARPVLTSRDLAVRARLSPPTVSKLLKLLARQQLLVSHRGVKGGYSLARAPETITVADVITALEGPIALADCTDRLPGLCRIEALCPVRDNWQRINRAVCDALEGLTLADLTRPAARRSPAPAREPAVAGTAPARDVEPPR